jgi:hypothetical protein
MNPLESENMLKNDYFICLLVLWVALGSAHAQKDAALVTTASGAATWQAEGGRPNAVQSFMKLREGDQAEVKADARLQLVYLASGEVEQWEGPSSFVIGSMRTTKIASGTPATRKLPVSMVERLARAPEVMADIRNRAGVTVTRGVASPAVLEARRNYVEARELFPSADITPELDLFIVLYMERQYFQARNVLQDMQKRAPDDPVVNELAQRLEKALRVE